MEKLDRIKTKIAKLLNLAEKASNEHEAANAMSKARALMDAYQISQSDIIDVAGVAREFLKAQGSRAFAAVPSYLSTLSVHIARFNDCQVVFEWEPVTYKKKDGDSLKMGKVIVFRGQKLDVELAIDMFARLQGSINSICKAYFEQAGFEGKYSVKLGTAFKLGAVHTIGQLLQKEIDETRAKLVSSSGTSLMVLKSNAVAEYFGNVEYSKGKAKRLDDEGHRAYSEGKERAKKIQVHAKQIGG
ncbi:protein of unknown function DUF2786 [Aeromonas phage Gekk3-15]